MAFSCLIGYLYFWAGSEDEKKVRREAEREKDKQKMIDSLSLTYLLFIYLSLFWSKPAL